MLSSRACMFCHPGQSLLSESGQKKEIPIFSRWTNIVLAAYISGMENENLPPEKGPFGGLTARIIGLAAVVGALGLLMTNFKTLTGALGITSSTIPNLFWNTKPTC